MNSRAHSENPDEAAEAADTGPQPTAEFWAGTMCTPWSHFGSKLGLADPATVPYLCWVNEMKALDADLVWFENSVRFPLPLLEQKIGNQSHIVSVTVGAEHIGWPLRGRGCWLARSAERAMYGSDHGIEIQRLRLRWCRKTS